MAFDPKLGFDADDTPRLVAEISALIQTWIDRNENPRHYLFVLALTLTGGLKKLESAPPEVMDGMLQDMLLIITAGTHTCDYKKLKR